MELFRRYAWQVFRCRASGKVDIFAWYRKKYPAANPALAMRSMSYFVDAETMPMPKMLIPFDWEEAKDRIRAAVRKFAT